tara:strand:+ start:269 stop:466 length:198 start_codon:yes stop_codon:yes gene_type:complete
VLVYTESIKAGCIFPNLKGLKKKESCKGFNEFLNNHTQAKESKKYQVWQKCNPISITTLPESIES